MHYTIGKQNITGKNSIIKVLVVLTAYIFITGCESKKSMNDMIMGDWTIYDYEIDSFGLPNNCNDIVDKDVFTFSENSLFTVKKDDGSSCPKYEYRIKDSIIYVLGSDIEFKLKVKKIDEKSLILSSTFLPKKMMIEWREEYADYKKNGFDIKLNKD